MFGTLRYGSRITLAYDGRVVLTDNDGKNLDVKSRCEYVDVTHNQTRTPMKNGEQLGIENFGGNSLTIDITGSFISILGDSGKLICRVGRYERFADNSIDQISKRISDIHIGSYSIRPQSSETSVKRTTQKRAAERTPSFERYDDQKRQSRGPKVIRRRGLNGFKNKGRSYSV